MLTHFATAAAAAARHPGAVQGFLPAQDDVPAPLPHATYWPCDLLNTFVLRMAAEGHCVNTDMMLGHRAYACGRLALARASGDEALRALALRLQVYFDAAAPEGCHVAAALGDAEPGRLLLV